MLWILFLSKSLLTQTVPPPATLEKLRKGEVVVRQEPKAGASGNFTVAQVLVEAPPEKVWRLVADCANYSRRMPRVVKSSASNVKLEKDFGNGTMTCTVTTDLPWPFEDLTSVSKVTLKVEPSQNLWVREWTLLEGDYEYQEGSWTLLALADGQHTLATYRLRAKPKVALPESLLRAAQDRAVPDMMRSLRTRKWNQPLSP